MPLTNTTGTAEQFEGMALRVSGLETDVNAATATAGAATLNAYNGQITSESLTTAAGADYTLTLTDSCIAAADMVLTTVQLGTSTTGDALHGAVTPGAGTCTIVIRNGHATAAFNGTIIIGFLMIKRKAQGL